MSTITYNIFGMKACKGCGDTAGYTSEHMYHSHSRRVRVRENNGLVNVKSHGETVSVEFHEVLSHFASRLDRQKTLVESNRTAQEANESTGNLLPALTGVPATRYTQRLCTRK